MISKNHFQSKPFCGSVTLYLPKQFLGSPGFLGRRIWGMDERSELQVLLPSASALGQVDMRTNMNYFTPRIYPVFV